MNGIVQVPIGMHLKHERIYRSVFLDKSAIDKTVYLARMLIGRNWIALGAAASEAEEKCMILADFDEGNMDETQRLREVEIANEAPSDAQQLLLDACDPNTEAVILLRNHPIAAGTYLVHGEHVSPRTCRDLHIEGCVFPVPATESGLSPHSIELVAATLENKFIAFSFPV